jgi:malonyl-CoA decarboxylase
LSPAPNFAEWLKRERLAETSRAITPEDRLALAHLDSPGWWQSAKTRDEVEEPLLRAAAWYFLRARGRNGAPIDQVARFHLGNGARLERLNWLADVSDKAIEQSCGLMVNYLYELDDIEKNHEAYAKQRTVIAASAVTRLVKGSPRDVVPLAG